MPLADSLIIQNEKRLHSLQLLCLLDTPAEPAFDHLTELAATVLNVPVALVTLVDANRQFFKSQVGLEEPWSLTRQTPLTHSLCQNVVALAEPLVIEDARTHPLAYDNLAIADLKVIAYAGIPIFASDGSPIGSFCAIDHQPRQWTPYEIDILTKLAHSVMTEVNLRAKVLEQERTEQERERLLAHITELEQLKTDMIRVAAHDLRSPLGLIMGYAALLRSDEMTDEQHEFVEEINKASKRMESMIRDILSLERIEARSAGEREEINLNALIQTAFDNHRSEAIQKHQDYTLTLPAHPYIMQGDSVQILEAIENLIGNAIKYTPQKGRVTVSLADEGVFQVEDTGYGIPENQQNELFAPFYRAKSPETQTIPGTGLGLHLVKRIVERHGGNMIFHSEYGKGSIFGFSFARASEL